MKNNTKLSKQKIYGKYNRIVMRLVCDKCLPFLQKYNHSIHDLYIQTDSDCKKLVLDNGLKVGHAGTTHDFADVVAWGNNCGMEPAGVSSYDLTHEIKKELGES